MRGEKRNEKQAGQKWRRGWVALLVAALVPIFADEARGQLCEVQEICGFCGNEICELDEELSGCAEDCDPPLCGDFRCEEGEDEVNCPDDCDVDSCGDFQCGPGEDPVSCPDDCGCTLDQHCDDGNPCTDDRCSEGVCVYDNNSDPCEDGDLCTTGDLCQSGVCAPGAPVVCTALDACHEAGICDPGTGLCSEPIKPDGAECDDGNECTTVDRCHVGICAGEGLISCELSESCREMGQCVAEPESPELPRENCSNGLDDDGDGLVDCEDTDCAASLDCAKFGGGGCSLRP